MGLKKHFGWAVAICLVSVAGAGAQQRGAANARTDVLAAAQPDSSAAQPQLATPAQTGANAPASVPRLIRFSGILQNLAGRPIFGPVDVTFSLYAEQAGGSALWFETQTVQADALGRYSALLGAMSPAGVPMELFTENQARWLGVMVQGLPEQSRVLLVSVPYALKAGDAETLGGRPAADYQLTPDSSDSTGSVAKQGTTTTRGGAKKATGKTGSPTPQTLTATQNYIPVMTANDGSLGNSVMYQSGGFIGIGTKAPAFPLDLNSNVFAIGPKASQPGAGGTMRFRDDTGTVRWLFGIPGSAGSTDFFIYNNVNGHAPIYIQNGAASYSLYMKGNGNVGVGTTAPAAKLDVNGNINIPQTGPDGGYGVITMGGTPFIHGYCNACSIIDNTFVGHLAGNFGTTGSEMTAVGYGALTGDTTGIGNSAFGYDALGTNTTGGANTAVGYGALVATSSGNGNTALGSAAGWSNHTGSNDTFVGDAADLSDSFGVYNYATAIGEGAKVGESNALVLGGTGFSAVDVGIGTPTPRSVLDAVVSSAGTLGPTVTLTNSGGGAGSGSSVDFNTYSPSTSGTYNPSSRIEALDNNFSNDIAFLTNKEGAANNGLVNQVEITKNGQLVVDASHNNAASLSGSSLSGAGLIFGGAGSGEGIASDRSTSLNQQYSLDFYTAFTQRMAIYNAGLVSMNYGLAVSDSNADTYAVTVNGNMVVNGCTAWLNGDHQGSCVSDVRLKTNIQPFPTVLDKLVQLQPVHFEWKESNPPQYRFGIPHNTGLIAQQVQKVFPDMVSQDPNGYLQVNYGQLQYLLLQGVRELKDRDDSLRTLVTRQREQIARLNRSNAAKDAQLHKLTSEVEQLRKTQAEMTSLEARLARLEAKSNVNAHDDRATASTGRGTGKQQHTDVARVGF